MLPRSSFRAARALELPVSYAPRQSLRARCMKRNQAQNHRRYMGEFPRNYKIKPDPLEEWRNPPPSKWPNRIRLLMLPFLGAIIYSMVRSERFVLEAYTLTLQSGQSPIHSRLKRPRSLKKMPFSSAKTACPHNRPCVCEWNSS